MTIKDELMNVYSKRISDFQHIQDVCKNDKRNKIHGALLMSPNKRYTIQPFPLLVVGKETFGWCPFSDIVSVEECAKMMLVYEDFNVGERYYATPFWNMIRKIEIALGNEPYSCAWTNVSKYDQNSGTPDIAHEKLFSTVDNILLDEIRIITPKVCFFFTSYKFDNRLKNTFEQIEFIDVDGFSNKVLCQLKHPSLPFLSFRTYHPRYLRMRRMEKPIIDFICKQIET